MWIWRKQNLNTFSSIQHISSFQNCVFAKHKKIPLLGFKRHFDPSWHTLWSGNNWSGTYRSLFWLKFTFANSSFALKLNLYHISEFLSFFIHCKFPFSGWFHFFHARPLCWEIPGSCTSIHCLQVIQVFLCRQMRKF